MAYLEGLDQVPPDEADAFPLVGLQVLGNAGIDLVPFLYSKQHLENRLFQELPAVHLLALATLKAACSAKAQFSSNRQQRYERSRRLP